LGARTTNKLLRKLEEVRLSLWLEEEMRRRYGSKEQAKREIFARSASFLYLGNGRYGFAAASEYYFGKPLSSYTPEDAGEAALLAGIAKSPGVYAPVADVNVNPDNPIIGRYERSFSADPDIVTAHSLEVIEAHHEMGVLTTLKHFPGHGSSTGDSHLGFVDVTDTWAPVELEPFGNIIAAGQADVVMTAHIYNANLDPNYPATLSHSTITGLLREQLGWDGVVVTDDMGMGSITQYYGFDLAIALAIGAGADILAYANNSSVFDPTIPARAFAVIKGLVEQGVITESRIDQSYQRITQLKERLAE